ncbi:hypothetical protein TEA_019998 [Camellia sinensis var. sinensis]|uniref:Ionotropic glutamate receptor C-terminal domain-containing protein n=1 Tax=Camellia sinensis var. sinensis TaxID=542762 RepID=A0A4S4EYR1_CAMSN|nr:hypothetical protein TEA_019998 [Camellia sinensis var. sinensis]
MAQSTTNTTTVQVKVGVVLDMNTWVGKMGLKGISMALSDFYSSHVHYKTRLELHVRDSKDNVVGAAAAAAKEEEKQLADRLEQQLADRRSGSRSVVELLKTEQVKAIIGPLTSMQANFLIHLGEEAHVPIISFSATSSSLSYLRSPYFFRAALNDSSQVQPITAIIQAFGWKEVVPIYTENEYGEGLIPFLTDAFQENEIRVLYKSIIHPMASDEEIVAELYKLMTMQTRVFVVHMTCSLSARLFTKANEIGMMTIALAMAVEKVGPLNLSISNIAKNSTSDFESVEVSQNGIHLCQALSSTRFRGLSGNFCFVDGQLQSSAFEIVNVIGHGPRGIGFWTPKHGIVRQLKFYAVNTSYKDYSTSQANLKAIIWPGDTIYTPKGWVVPTNGKVLRVAVPVKNFYTDFVRVRRDPITNRTMVTGYCIDVFDAVMAALPYSVPYEYIPFEKPYGSAGSRRSSKGHVAKSWPLTGGQEGLLAGEDPDSEKKFDAVVGDVTIRENRSNYMDFTFSYTESGVTMIVPFKDKKNYKSAWVFFEAIDLGSMGDKYLFLCVHCFCDFDSQLKGYNTVEGELDAALSNQSIVAAFDEIPYLKLFTRKHCSKYTMVAPIHKTGGFGFAFRKGSHLVRDVLTAILHVIEEDKMLEIDKKWLQNNSCPDSTSTVSSNSLGVHSLWGLFLKVGVAASFALIIFMAVLAYEHRSFLVHLDLKYLWRKYILKHEDIVTAIDTHQDQACPSSSPLSITPSPPTQYSSAR